MSKPKLQLNSLELEAFKNMLVDGEKEYSKMYSTAASESLLFLTQLSEANIKMAALKTILLNVESKLRNKQHVYTIKLSAIDVFQLCCCILPTNNLSFYSKVKTIVLDHCINTLKYYQVIDENVCFKPALPELDKQKIATTHNYFTD